MAIVAIGGRTTAPGLDQPVPMPWPGSPLTRSRRDPLRFWLEAGYRPDCRQKIH